MWRCMWYFVANFLSHISHGYGLMCACIRLCLWKPSWRANAFSHDGKLQRYGLSPVCDRSCVCLSFNSLNFFGQKRHAWGRSPVCTRMCVSSRSFRPKLLPHSSHVWFRTFVWMRRWRFQLAFRSKFLPQNSQTWGISCSLCCMKNGAFYLLLFKFRIN